VKARFITRCGCQCYREVPTPPPPYFDIRLSPPVPNNGLVRPWLNTDGALTYDMHRDGLHRRRFKLSLESLDSWTRYPGLGQVWYDEVTDFDPSGFDVDRRTYAHAVGEPSGKVSGPPDTP